jgi:hypothetical protein
MSKAYDVRTGNVESKIYGGEATIALIKAISSTQLLSGYTMKVISETNVDAMDMKDVDKFLKRLMFALILFESA